MLLVLPIGIERLLSVTLGLLSKRCSAVAELEHAASLAGQLEAFRIKTPPKDALSDWRPVTRLDLAQALMLAGWWGERMLRPGKKGGWSTDESTPAQCV